MLVFIKKVFHIGSLFLSSLFLSITTPLSCISLNNQACKVRPEIINVIVMSLYFMLLVLKQLNVVVVVIILTIHMQKYVFLML